MLQVTQSPFLQALGHAIINSLWQFALLWLLYILLAGVSRFTSHQKFVTGLLLQLAGFSWFIGTLIFYYNQCTEFPVVNELPYDYASGILAAPAGVTLRERMFTLLLQGEQFLPYLSVAYLGLLVFLSVKWMQAYKYTRRVKLQGLKKIDVRWRLFVQQLAQQMGIKRSVKVYLSGIISSPVTIGFLKPIILVPLASINHLSTQQVEAVLLHELAHIKRYDYLVNILLSVIEVILFFNPFMQLISKQIKRERENCCDDWVLQFEYSATTYAKALLKLATFHTTTPVFAMHAADDKHVLLKRVKRMIEKNERSFNYRHQLVALLLLTVILSSIAWISPARQMAVSSKKADAHVVFQPLASKVENPLFNPIFFLANDKQVQKEMQHLQKQMAKTIVLHNLPAYIATKEKAEVIYNTPEPVAKNADVIITRKMNIVPARYFQLVDTSFKMDYQLLTASVWKELEKEVQVQLNAVSRAKAVSKENAMAVAHVKNMKALQGLTEDIRRAKLELVEANQSTASRVRTSRELQQLEQQVIRKTMKAVDLKKLSENINQHLIEVNNQLMLVTNFDEDTDDDAPVDLAYRTRVQEPRRSYSYEYPEPPATPAAATYKRTANGACSSSNTASNHSETNDTLEEAAPVTFTPPAYSIKVVKGKIIRIIKI